MLLNQDVWPAVELHKPQAGRWNFGALIAHSDRKNKAAIKLYESEGSQLYEETLWYEKIMH